MPCDSVQRTTVNLEALKVDDHDLLVKALESLGWTVTQNADGSLAARHPRHGSLTYANGQVRTESNRYQSQPDINEVKVAYAKQAVRKFATRFGWSITESKATGPNAVVALDATKKGF